MRLPNVMFALLALLPAIAGAAAPGTVELVQAPAWVERDGR